MSSARRYATTSKEALWKPHSFLSENRERFRRLALSVLGLLPSSLPDRFLRCLYCHYVFDDQRDCFSRLLESLQQIGIFVDTATCLEILEERRPLDGRYFHLSFDDGFRNIWSNAAPILRQLNVPALFFVPSGLVNADWDRASDYCRNKVRAAAVVEMVTWDDLKELVAQGFEIGSHTRSHARLSIASKAGHLQAEIQGSKAEFEERLSTECKYIAWPYGTAADIDDLASAAIKQAGYRACFGAIRGSILPGQTDKFRIPRHHFEAHWPWPHVRYFAFGNQEKRINR